MTPQDVVQRAQGYFAAVDRKHLADTLSYLTPDARFHIASHGLVFQGHTEIAGMFERLFAKYAQVWHGDFTHVVQAPDAIASQFRVRNTGHDGQLWLKNNCNFFRLKNGLFSEVFVYMSGDNALT